MIPGDTGPLARHRPFCDPSRHDDDVCVAPDLTALDGWRVGLTADDDTGPIIWPHHPDILPDETGGMSPAAAIALGEALIRQGRAALATTN